MPVDTEMTVTPAADTVAADTTASPDSSSSAAAAPDSAVTTTPASTPANRTYTDAQVQELIRGRVAQANKTWQTRLAEHEKKAKEYEAIVQRANAGIEGMARGFGFIKDEPEKPWAADIQSAREEVKQQYETQIREVEERRFLGMISNDFDRVKQAYPKYAGLPGFKDEFARAWKPGQDPVAAVKGIVSEYEKVFAATSNAVAEEKEKTLKTAPVGKGGGTSTSKTDEGGGPLRSRIKSALNSRRA
jgi:hypothetical protein